MSKTIRHNSKYDVTDHRRAGRPRRARRLAARGIERDQVDVRLIARTVIQIALNEAEREEAAHTGRQDDWELAR